MKRLSEIRKELKFYKELYALVETLKSIAASQYHMMEKAKERFDLFMNAFSGFFRVVNLVDVENPLVKLVSSRIGIVIVTSDSGFMGGLNQGVLRMAEEIEAGREKEEVALIVIGDKGATILADRGREFKFFRGINQETIYEQAVEVKNYVIGEVLAKRIGKVVVVYPKPVSFTAQTIEAITILPCGELFDIKAESEISRRTSGTGVLADATRVVVESSYSDMVEYLAGVWVTSKLYEIFEDSKLAEFSARALHLEGSAQKVEKELKKAQHLLFKATHERIDKGMRESFSATKVKKRKKKLQAEPRMEIVEVA
jgi:ATP synthase F1 gamma subunit